MPNPGSGSGKWIRPDPWSATSVAKISIYLLAYTLFWLQDILQDWSAARRGQVPSRSQVAATHYSSCTFRTVADPGLGGGGGGVGCGGAWWHPPPPGRPPPPPPWIRHCNVYCLLRICLRFIFFFRFHSFSLFLCNTNAEYKNYRNISDFPFSFKITTFGG